MPVRIPRAKTSELATFGFAGVAGFAPFYMMLPGAEERLASQTARWAPRWERNISYFAPPAQRIAQRVEPRVEKTVKKIDNRLPLEKMAKNVDRRIKSGIDKMSKE
ncbi:uncharacterized protein GGS25DRAFT_519155 [Hypoxylon fragiforme]|uniref:uncharacterized protein n=1 Tax=Hypoxylon fragiforme TaxID=63214 RepID=UPI0020C6D973|nr:uncharacterized protein GGS25DRAFT_519155 [Hypoxylon fragiforme]KAI2610856.1 hypothetical protein GGS25DRAFT_519155 [Hypoxylon fragiforme]